MSVSNKVDQFIADSDLAHRIVHGRRGEMVSTEGGEVKTFATVIGDIEGVREDIDYLKANQGTDRISATDWASGGAVQLSMLAGIYVGQGASVPDSDTGTHHDPASGLSVPNAGVYTWANVGWIRTGDNVALNAATSQDAIDGRSNTRAMTPAAMQAFTRNIEHASLAAPIVYTDGAEPDPRVHTIVMHDGRVYHPAGLYLPEGLPFSQVGPEAVVADIFGLAYVWLDASKTYFLAGLGYDGQMYCYKKSTAQVQEPVREVNTLANESHRSVNNMWSQWVWPLAVENTDGTRWRGAVGQPSGDSMGPIYVESSAAGDAPSRSLIGRSSGVPNGHKIDDHNAPAVVYDPSPSAQHPLRVFQCGHSVSWNIRCWNGQTERTEDLVEVDQISTGSTATYNQWFLNPADPSQLWGIFRSGGSGSPSWRIARSTGRGQPFDVSSGLWAVSSIYIAARPAADGSGIWIVFQGHAETAPDHTLRVAHLDWHGTLRRADGTVISQDIFTDTPPNPYTSGLYTELHTPASGQTLRFFSMWDFGDDLHVVFAEFPLSVSTAGSYKRSVLTLATGVVKTETIAACGGKIDSRSAPSYISGACIVSRDTVVCSRWWRDYGDVVVCRRRSDDWTEVTAAKNENAKWIRPECYVRVSWKDSRVRYSLSPWVSVIKCSGADAGYSDFYNWNADAFTFDTDRF